MSNCNRSNYQQDPRTLLSPVIATPAYDSDWRAESWIKNSHINDSSPFFAAQMSGYEYLEGPETWIKTVPECVSSNIGISCPIQNGQLYAFGTPLGNAWNFVENPEKSSSSNFALEAGAELRRDYDAVYDSRSNGYGDARRAFINPDNGSCEYYYKDIDDCRKEHNIVRSNLFNAPYCNDESVGLNDVRDIANQAFIEDTGNQRLDLQASLMRKMDRILWQRRLAPIAYGRF